MWLLVALDRCSSYAVTVVWELAWADSVLVVLDEWSSYRGYRLSKFSCIYSLEKNNGKNNMSVNVYAY